MDILLIAYLICVCVYVKVSIEIPAWFWTIPFQKLPVISPLLPNLTHWSNNYPLLGEMLRFTEFITGPLLSRCFQNLLCYMNWTFLLLMSIIEADQSRRKQTITVLAFLCQRWDVGQGLRLISADTKWMNWLWKCIVWNRMRTEVHIQLKFSPAEAIQIWEVLST